METTQRWKLPSITRKRATEQTAVACALPPLQTSALSERCEALTSRPLLCTPLEWSRVPVLDDTLAGIIEHVDGVRFAVILPPPLWQAALEALLGPAPRSHVPTEAERGALLYLLSQLVQPALGNDFYAAGVTTTHASLCAALCVSTIEDVAWTARCTVALGDASGATFILCPTRLVDAASFGFGHRNYVDVPVPCLISIGEVMLRASELRTLTDGAVILLDHFSIQQTTEGLFGAVRLTPVEASDVYWECDMQGNQLKLLRMKEDNPQPALQADLRDLPVRIHVELARMTLTFGELETLSPGQVLRLAKSAGDCVTLSANGLAIGEGEVVDVEGELGVRILRLSTSA